MSPVEALQSGLFVAIAIACLALWNQIVRRAASGREIIAYEPRRAAPWGARDVALIAVTALVLQGACAWPLLWDSADADDDAATAIETDQESATIADSQNREGQQVKIKQTFSLITAASLANLLALAAAYAWLRSRGANHEDLGLDVSRPGRDFKLGVAGFVVASIPVLTIQATLSQFIEPTHPVTDIFAAHPSAMMLALTALFAVLIAPLAEEFFFRVILQGWLEALYARRAALRLAENDLRDERSAIAGVGAASKEFEHEIAERPEPFLVDVAQTQTGDAGESSATVDASPPMQANSGLMPVLLSSLVFAAVHWEHGPSSVPLFFFALALGYLYRQTHRLWPSVVAHACLNGFSVLIMVTGGS